MAYKIKSLIEKGFDFNAVFPDRQESIRSSAMKLDSCLRRNDGVGAGMTEVRQESSPGGFPGSGRNYLCHIVVSPQAPCGRKCGSD